MILYHLVIQKGQSAVAQRPNGTKDSSMGFQPHDFLPKETRAEGTLVAKQREVVPLDSPSCVPSARLFVIRKPQVETWGSVTLCLQHIWDCTLRQFVMVKSFFRYSEMV